MGVCLLHVHTSTVVDEHLYLVHRKRKRNQLCTKQQQQIFLLFSEGPQVKGSVPAPVLAPLKAFDSRLSREKNKGKQARKFTQSDRLLLVILVEAQARLRANLLVIRVCFDKGFNRYVSGKKTLHASDR